MTAPLVDARALMEQDHPHLAAWALALRHSWEPNRAPWEPDEVPWVEDMVEAVYVLFGEVISVHDDPLVEARLRSELLGRTYLSAWYLMTVSQYGQLAGVEE